MSNLILSDAVDGTCFKIRFIFEAVSPADEYLMTDRDAHDVIGPSVTATSETIFCAENKRTFAIAKHPGTGDIIDQSVAQDTLLSQPPRVRSTTPLPSVNLGNVGGEDSIGFYVPRGADIGIRSVQLVPTMTGTEEVKACQRDRYSTEMLDGASCTIFQKYALMGGCEDHTDSLRGPLGGTTSVMYKGKNVGRPEADSSVPAVLASSRDFTNPTNLSAAQVMAHPLYGRIVDPLMEGFQPAMIEEFSFDEFKWRSTLPNKGTALTLGVASTSGVSATDIDEASIFPEMIFESTPATIQLLTQPPKTVVVGVPFLMSVRVLISSGAPLRGVNVGAALSPSSGSDVSPFQYILDQFRIVKASSEDEPPALVEDSATSLSNKVGVARFILILKAGTTGVNQTMQFTAGEAKSRRTQPFIIQNPMLGLAGAKPEEDNWPQRVGQDAVGSPYSLRLGSFGLIESFPVVVPLDFSIHVDLSFNPYLFYNDVTVDHNVVASTLKFRVFTESSLIQQAEDQAALDQIVQERDNATAALYNGATELGENLGVAYMDPSGAADAWGAADECEDVSHLSVALEAARMTASSLNSLEYAQLADLTRSLMEAVKGAGMLSSFFTLFTSGSTPQVAPPAPTNTAEVQPTFNVTYNYDDNTLSIEGVELYVRSPGTLRLQLMLAGIASPIFGEVVVEQYNSQSATSIAAKYAFQFCMTAFICFMAFGNSDWHKPFPMPVLISISMLCWGLGACYALVSTTAPNTGASRLLSCTSSSGALVCAGQCSLIDALSLTLAGLPCRWGVGRWHMVAHRLCLPLLRCALLAADVCGPTRWSLPNPQSLLPWRSHPDAYVYIRPRAQASAAGWLGSTCRRAPTAPRASGSCPLPRRGGRGTSSTARCWSTLPCTPAAYSSGSTLLRRLRVP